MSERLRLAVEGGHVVLPEGEVLVLGATTQSDLSVLDPERTRIMAWFHDAHRRFSAEGWQTFYKSGGPAPCVIVLLPRARERQKALMRQAMSLATECVIVDGAKENGVEAFYKQVRGRGEVSPAWSKAHGKVFTVTAGDFDDWPDDLPTLQADGWWRAPGVFSFDGPDAGSRLLADALPATLAGEVVDLGCGWGYLAKPILERDAVTGLTLIDNDKAAQLSAYRNFCDPNGNLVDSRLSVVWADALAWRPETPVDHVVTNPPFHTSRKADLELGRAFIRAAAGMLKPKGSLWLVANRHLPYEQTLEDAFHSVQPIGSNPSFKIFQATSPKRRKG